ncbi:hypothetical protein [Amycolatopsis sacchari]|uniref:hypothetical protein n=1 Tax=Amycolatopsis sacchari TaxID=115433 RepID=UPI003D73C12E
MRLLVLLILLLVTACGARLGAPQLKACPAIAVLTGMTIDVAPTVASRYDRLDVDVCWDGACHTYPVPLSPAPTPVAPSCTGTAPDDACAARMRETGGKVGFVAIPGLPAAPVQVTTAGNTITVTPSAVPPRDPDCGSGGTQAHLVLDERGLRAR